MYKLLAASLHHCSPRYCCLSVCLSAYITTIYCLTVPSQPYVSFCLLPLLIRGLNFSFCLLLMHCFSYHSVASHCHTSHSPYIISFYISLKGFSFRCLQSNHLIVVCVLLLSLSPFNPSCYLFLIPTVAFVLMHGWFLVQVTQACLPVLSFPETQLCVNYHSYMWFHLCCDLMYIFTSAKKVIWLSLFVSMSLMTVMPHLCKPSHDCNTGNCWRLYTTVPPQNANIFI